MSKLRVASSLNIIGAGVSGFLLLAILIKIYRECFWCNDAFEMLSIQNLDDLTNFRITAWHWELIRQHEWRQVFSFTLFGYGNIFWFPISCFVGLCLRYGSDADVIAATRIVSSYLPFLLSLGAFYAICRARHYSRANTIQALFLIVTSIPVVLSAKQFHTYGIAPTFVLWSFYFLSEPRTKKRRYLALVLFGMSIALKITNLCAAPLFVVLFNENRLREKGLIKDNIFAFFMIVSVAAASFSVTLFLLPFGYMDYWDQLWHLSVWMTSNTVTSGHLAFGMKNFFEFHYAWPLCALAAGLAVFALARRGAGPSPSKPLAMTTLLTCLAVLFVAERIADLKGVYSYVLPITMFLPIVFVDFLQYRKIPCLILALAIGNLWFHHDLYREHLNRNKAFAHSDAYQNEWRKLKTLKEKLAPYPNSVFFTDNLVAFPSDSVRKAAQTIYFFEPIGDQTWEDVDFIVIGKTSAIWEQIEKNQSEPYHFSPLGTSLLKGAILKDASFEVFYEDASFRASRRIHNNESLNSD